MTTPLEYAVAPVVDGVADWPAVKAERFGSDGRPATYEPAVDRDGDALWLSPDGEVRWQTADTSDPSQWPGWRRLYVRTQNGGETP